MVLDLDEAALTVFVNGEFRGVMAQPGMTDSLGQPVTDNGGAPVARLAGPVRWAVDVCYGASVEIKGPLPVPITTLGAALRRLALASMRNQTLLPIS